MASPIDQLDPMAGRTSVLERLSQGQQIDPQEKENIDRASLNSMGEFEKGLRRFGYSALATSEAFVGQMAETVAPEFTKRRIAGAMETMRSMPETLRPRYETFDQAQEAGDYLPYVAGALGEGLGSVGTMVAGGLLTRGASLRAAPAVQRAAQFAGGAATMLPMEGGETALSLRDNPEAMANTTPGERTAMTLGRGTVNAALENIVPNALFTNQIAGLGKRIAPGLRPGLENVGRKFAAGTIGEAGTEATQDLTGQYVENMAAPGTGYDFAPTREAAIRGGLTGGVLGGAGGVAQGVWSNAKAGTDRAIEEVKTRKPLDALVATTYDVINNPANVSEDLTNMTMGALVEAKTRIPEYASEAKKQLDKGVNIAADALIDAEEQFSRFIMENVEPENQAKYAEMRTKLGVMTVGNYRILRDELEAETGKKVVFANALGKAGRGTKRGAEGIIDWTKEVYKGAARAIKTPEDGVKQSVELDRLKTYNSTQLEELADLYSMVDPALATKFKDADPVYKQVMSKFLTAAAMNPQGVSDKIKKNLTKETGGLHFDKAQRALNRLYTLYQADPTIGSRLNQVFEDNDVPDKARTSLIEMAGIESFDELSNEQKTTLTEVAREDLPKVKDYIAYTDYGTSYDALTDVQKRKITRGVGSAPRKAKAYFETIVQDEFGDVLNRSEGEVRLAGEKNRLKQQALTGLGIPAAQQQAVIAAANANTFEELSPKAQQAFEQAVQTQGSAYEQGQTVQPLRLAPEELKAQSQALFTAAKQQLTAVENQRVDMQRTGQIESEAPREGTGVNTGRITDQAALLTPDQPVFDDSGAQVQQSEDGRYYDAEGQEIAVVEVEDTKGRESPFDLDSFHDSLRDERMGAEGKVNKRTKNKVENSIEVALSSPDLPPEALAFLVGRRTTSPTSRTYTRMKPLRSQIVDGKFIANVNLKSLYSSITQPDRRDAFMASMPAWSERAGTNEYEKRKDIANQKVAAISTLNNDGIEIDPADLQNLMMSDGVDEAGNPKQISFLEKYGIDPDGPLIKIQADVDMEKLIGESSNVLIERDAKTGRAITFPELGVNYGSYPKQMLRVMDLAKQTAKRRSKKAGAPASAKDVVARLREQANALVVKDLPQPDADGNYSEADAKALPRIIKNNKTAVATKSLVEEINNKISYHDSNLKRLQKTANNKKLTAGERSGAAIELRALQAMTPEAAALQAVRNRLAEAQEKRKNTAEGRQIQDDARAIARAMVDGSMPREELDFVLGNEPTTRRVIERGKDESLAQYQSRVEAEQTEFEVLTEEWEQDVRKVIAEANGIIDTTSYRLGFNREELLELANSIKSQIVVLDRNNEQRQDNLSGYMENQPTDWDGAYEDYSKSLLKAEQRLRDATGRIHRTKAKRGKYSPKENEAQLKARVAADVAQFKEIMQPLYIRSSQRFAATIEAREKQALASKQPIAELQTLLKDSQTWVEKVNAKRRIMVEKLTDEQKARYESMGHIGKLQETEGVSWKAVANNPAIAPETVTKLQKRVRRAIKQERGKLETNIDKTIDEANSVEALDKIKPRMDARLSELTPKRAKVLRDKFKVKREDIVDPDGAAKRATKRTLDAFTPEQRKFYNTIRRILGPRVAVMFGEKLGTNVNATYQRDGSTVEELDAERTYLVTEVLRKDKKDRPEGFENVTDADLRSQIASLRERAAAKREDRAVQGIIRVAAGMEGKRGLAEHEALHGAFDLLFKHRPEDRRTLGTAFTAGLAGRRLREYFKDAPEVLNVIDPKSKNYNAEEASAYGFQVWMTDPQILKLGERGQGVFERVMEILRALFNILTPEQKANMLLKDLRDGKTAETNITAMQRYEERDRSAMDHVIEFEKALGSVVSYFTDTLFRSTYSRMQATENPALAQIARLGYQATGEEGVVSGPGGVEGGAGYIQQLRMQTTARLNELGGILSELGPEGTQQMYETHIAGSDTGRSEKVDKWLREFREYQIEAGVDLNDAGPKYFPLPWDPQKVLADREGFIAMLDKYRPEFEKLTPAVTEDGTTPLAITPEDIWQNIAEYGERGEVLTDVTGQNAEPIANHTRTRFLAFLSPEDRRPFMSDKPDEVLTHYAQQAVRNAEYVRAFGRNGARYNSLINEARDVYGASNEDLALAKDYVDGLLNNKGQGMSRELKDAYGALTLYQNVRLLPFASFSSLVDPIGIGVRTNDAKATFETFTYSMKNLFRDWRKQYTPDKWEKIATDYGYIEASGTPISTDARYTGITLSGKTRAFNDGFFRLNLLNGLVRNHHIMATKAADKFLLRASENFFGEETSARYLSEVGVSSGDIVYSEALQRNLMSEDEFIEAGFDPADAKASAQRVRQAMGMIVRQSLIQPNSAEMPNWMSNPYLAPIAHLKSFVFGFTKTIIDRLMHEARNGNPKPLLFAASYVPGMIAADFIKDMVSNMGDEPEYKKNWGMADYLQQGVYRSGLTGVGQFFTDAGNDMSRGGYGAESFLGPTVEQIQDWHKVWNTGSGERFWSETVNALPANAIYDQWIDP